MPPREGQTDVGIVQRDERGRWGERSDEIMELWPPLLHSKDDSEVACRKLRAKLVRWRNAHFRGEGYGDPRTGGALIEDLKTEETVDQLL